MSGSHFTFWMKDWYGDQDLMECAAASQMVWFDMLFRLMRTTSWRLEINGRAPSVEELAGKLRRPVEVVSAALEDLEAHGVFSRDENGVIFCRKGVKALAKKAAKAAPAEAPDLPDLLSYEPPKPQDKPPPRRRESAPVEDEKTAKKRAQSAERNRRWRARKRNERDARVTQNSVTRDAGVTHLASRETQNSVTRSVTRDPQALENIESARRVTQNPSPFPIPIPREGGGGDARAGAHDLGPWPARIEAALAIIGEQANRTTGGFATWAPLKLLAEPPTGPPCDWDADVLPAIAEVAANCAAQHDPLRSWRHPAIARTALRNRNLRLQGLSGPDNARPQTPTRNRRGAVSRVDVAMQLAAEYSRQTDSDDGDAEPDACAPPDRRLARPGAA